MEEAAEARELAAGCCWADPSAGGEAVSFAVWPCLLSPPTSSLGLLELLPCSSLHAWLPVANLHTYVYTDTILVVRSAPLYKY